MTPSDPAKGREEVNATTTATSERPTPPRYALTRKEAARSLGMGLTSFAEHVQPHLRLVRLGTLRLVPVSELDRWINENAF